jgi:hypothetical protein
MCTRWYVNDVLLGRDFLVDDKPLVETQRIEAVVALSTWHAAGEDVTTHVRIRTVEGEVWDYAFLGLRLVAGPVRRESDRAPFPPNPGRLFFCDGASAAGQFAQHVHEDGRLELDERALSATEVARDTRVRVSGSARGITLAMSAPGSEELVLDLDDPIQTTENPSRSVGWLAVDLALLLPLHAPFLALCVGCDVVTFPFQLVHAASR